MGKRIAVVGSGISGSLCARLLATEHEVTLLEAGDTLGGHTHTIDVEAFGQTWSADTGFMVFNDRTYPNFIRMLQLLGIDSQASDMSFSVHVASTGLEYQGSSLNGLFAQRRNLLRPSFFRMLSGIMTFNYYARQLLDTPDDGLTLQDWIDQCNDDYVNAEFIDQEVIDHYLLPMTSAIWSAPREAMMEFPVRFLARFLENHGLLQVYNRPQWRTIPGGARRYLQALLHPLGDSVRNHSRVTSVARVDQGVRLTINDQEQLACDTVVLASHAQQSLAMLESPTSLERETLGAFRYQSNDAYVHLDEKLLPTRRRAWASWNYRLGDDPTQPAAVTYDLSRLQRLATPTPILQTLNPTDPIEPSKVLQKLQFEHPLFDASTHTAQTQHDRLHEDGKVFFCGAYWGYGFHEDGVVSALKVCEHFGINLDRLVAPCKVASTKAESSTFA